MNKVLFISNYREGTGYSNAAIDYILALDEAGVDVVPRHLTLSGVTVPVPQRIEELEAKSAIGCDVNIQYTLPHFMSYNGKYKNIAMFECETSDFKASGWQAYLNQMDEIWVSSTAQRAACRASDVDHNLLKSIKHTADIRKYQKSYEKFNIPHLKDKFTFYFIGELNKRKNVEALIRAFHTEFDPSEDVELILKVNIPGLDEQATRTEVDRYSEEVKKGLKLYSNVSVYKKEAIIPGRMSDEDIMRLHATCDCFVMPSYGEGWCKPAFDAMAMGKTPIVAKGSALSEFISDNNGYLCDVTYEPAFGCVGTMNGLYTGRESWHKINIFSLMEQMRKAYENREAREKKAMGGIEKAREFSYNKVGTKMKQLLENS